MTRKLARIAQITDIKPIPDADAIECAVVENGWNVVVKKGDYQVGDLAIYCEVDSWIPHKLAPFLSKGQEPREYNGVKGERLRTIKLRGQVSQGLLLPFDVQPAFSGIYKNIDGKVWFSGAILNTDKTFTHSENQDKLTEILGIQKYEPPIPVELFGYAKGEFPSFIPKTDQERCQNLHDEIFNEHYDESYEVTIKLDGTSCTIYYKNGEIGVCNRNWDLKETEGNTLWKCARSQGIIEGLEKLGRNLAIQGEVIGEGIQKNQEKIKGQKFYIFDIYDIDAGRYLNAYERYNVSVDMVGDSQNSVIVCSFHVPILGTYTLKDLNIHTIEDLLEYADGPSMNPQAKREGLVFKSLDSDFTFKAISNKWLLKNDG
jgi:RNA ligase (TIGR02306 family)